MEENIIDQIRRPDFDFRKIKHEDTMAYHFNSVNPGDFSICFNDKVLEFWSQDFCTEKMATLTQGKIYKILDKKIKPNVRTDGDTCIQILNDKNKKVWILTDRFAWHPELAQNSIRYERLTEILNGDIIDPWEETK